MEMVETTPLADKPMCGIDQTAVETPTISCQMPVPDFGCGCSTAGQGGMPGFFVLLVALWRRRTER